MHDTNPNNISKRPLRPQPEYQRFDRAANRIKDVPGAVLKSHGGVAAVVAALYNQSPLSVFTNYLVDFVTLVSNHGEKSVVKRSFEVRFLAMKFRYSDHRFSILLSEAISAFLLLASSSDWKAQRLPMLSATSSKYVSAGHEGNWAIANDGAILNLADYKVFKSEFCQCDRNADQ